MAHCEHCGRKMAGPEAREYLCCGLCWKRYSIRGGFVRNLNQRGSEEIGRPARASRSLGGAPKPAWDEDDKAEE